MTEKSQKEIATSQAAVVSSEKKAAGKTIEVSKDKNHITERNPIPTVNITLEKFEEMFHVKHFSELLKEWGLQPCDRQWEQLYIFYKDMLSWNQVMNLTAITEPDEVLTKHYLDSLSICQFGPAEKLREGIFVLDVGTGAGFPGIPLAIMFPQSRFVLMDSLNKRIQYLNTTIQNMGLNNVRAVHARAEELARQKEYRERFDLVCSRAVANLSVLSEYCIPFVRINGSFAAYKTEKAEEELKNAERAIQILGGRIGEVHNFTIPTTDYERTLIVIDKIGKTPNKYPRKAGVPSKLPLK